MKISSLFLTLGALSTHALGAVINIDGKDHGVFVPEWEVEITPGGEKVTLNGTVEEVHRELLLRNPNWDEDFKIKAGSDSEPAEPRSESSTLVKRTDFSGAKYNCFGRWKGCPTSTIVSGMDYLRKVPGRPTNGAGPGNCGRVSCSYNSAIWWCNDDKKPKTLNSFSSIADGARVITSNCVRPGGWGNQFSYTAGQVFHPTNWNVIVRADSC